ncbi:D-arabinose 5-phosphate isomerase [Klebsiella aerogenes]|nr:D-arabinose 5-phosphate isomerase [Klebsiella aerogenes]
MRNASIADVMTRGGIRIRPGTLAVDALNLMQSRHITCVLVADATICWVWYICTISCARA